MGTPGLIDGPGTLPFLPLGLDADQAVALVNGSSWPAEMAGDPTDRA
jgi:hypothetical protein